MQRAAPRPGQSLLVGVAFVGRLPARHGGGSLRDEPPRAAARTIAAPTPPSAAPPPSAVEPPRVAEPPSCQAQPPRICGLSPVPSSVPQAVRSRQRARVRRGARRGQRAAAGHDAPDASELGPRRLHLQVSAMRLALVAEPDDLCLVWRVVLARPCRRRARPRRAAHARAARAPRRRASERPPRRSIRILRIRARIQAD